MKLSKNMFSHDQQASHNSSCQQKLEAIAYLGNLLFSEFSAEKQIQQSLDIALKIFDAKAASFQIYEEKTKELVFHQVGNEKDKDLLGRSISVQKGINGRVFRTGTAEVYTHVKDCPEWNPYIDQTTGNKTESMLTAPVKRKDGSTIGVVQVLNMDKDEAESELKTLEIFCLYLGQAIERELIQQQSKKQHEYLNLIREFESTIESIPIQEKTLDRILEQAVRFLNVDAGRIWLFNPQTETLQASASFGLTNSSSFINSVSVGESYAGRLATQALEATPKEKLFLSISDLSLETGDLLTVGPLQSEGFMSYHAVPLFNGTEFNGVIEIYSCKRGTMGEDWFQFFNLIAAITATAISKDNLISTLQTSNQELIKTLDETLGSFAALLDLRTREPKGHVERVTQTMMLLAREMGIPEYSLDHMWRGAMLHDLGKIAVPDSILLKTGPLNEEEWLILKNHPLHILELLWPIEYLRPALDIPCYHHEKWDGSGYPHGLSGEQIPLAARIFAVIEAWDIMRSDRPFRAGWNKEKVRAYIAKESGKAYDPRVVDAFLNLNL